MSNGTGIKIGIIGGTGLNNVNIIKDSYEVEVDTIYGKPSDKLICGKINGIDCVILPRHDKLHSTSPTNVNYRANIVALKNAGCHVIIATTACGSLSEDYQPGDLVLLDDFIDHTKKRVQTFYDGTRPSPFDKVCHIPMSPCFSSELRNAIAITGDKLNLKYHKIGTMVTIEGPRFSSKAESKLFQKWGAHVINMTTCPEVILCREIGIPYASVALVTDYDCWRENESSIGHVDVETVMKMFRQNISKLISIVTESIPEIAKVDWKPILEDNENKIKSSQM
jgi:5'-methylthioadenosine phosphorylase